MKRPFVAIAAAVLVAGCAELSPTATTGVQRLYVLNCGEGVAGDIGRWSPGVNEGKSMAFVDNCYLIKHAQGWMLWDTGIMDAVAKTVTLYAWDAEASTECGGCGRKRRGNRP